MDRESIFQTGTITIKLPGDMTETAPVMVGSFDVNLAFKVAGGERWCMLSYSTVVRLQT